MARYNRGAMSIDLQLEGSNRVIGALKDVQPQVKAATLPVMEEIARETATMARANAQPYHPHNLWRASGHHGERLNPRYSVTHPGTYWLRVQSPSGEVGAIEQRAEFMSRSTKVTGAALVKALDYVHGRPGGAGNGRILWQAFDQIQPQMEERIRQAVWAAETFIQGEMGGDE